MRFTPARVLAGVIILLLVVGGIVLITTPSQYTATAFIPAGNPNIIEGAPILVNGFHEGKVVSYEMPKTVDLKVTDTPPIIKGATATNQLKEAKLETGLTTRVPGFIEIGETIRISTETGGYLSRA